MALHRGPSVDKSRVGEEAGDDAVPRSSTTIHSSFTAINSPTSGQLPTPRTTFSRFSQAIRSDRQRNPAVAQYLGLGTEEAISPFDRSSPLPSAQPPHQKRKRATEDSEKVILKRNEEETTEKAPKQKHGPGGLRVTKPTTRQTSTPKATQRPATKGAATVDGGARSSTSSVAISKVPITNADSIHGKNSVLDEQPQLQISMSDTLGPSSTFHLDRLEPKSGIAPDDLTTDIPLENFPRNYLDDRLGSLSGQRPRKRVKLVTADQEVCLSSPSAKGIEHASISNSSKSPVTSIRKCSHDDALGPYDEVLPVLSSPTAPIEKAIDDYDEFDDVFSSIIFDSTANHNRSTDSQPHHSANDHTLRRECSHSKSNEDFFDDGIADDDLLIFTADSCINQEAKCSRAHLPLSSEVDMPDTQREPGPLDPHKESAHSLDGPHLTLPSPLEHFEASVKQLVPLNMHDMDMRPIVRAPFPSQVRDRSPVIGLSPTSILRTCFRIGEAVKTGSSAFKSGKHVLLELYARVLSTERAQSKQEFIFCDLFHTKPPYLKAEYDAIHWRSVPLYSRDSGFFLERKHVLCRCIGRMHRKDKQWVMEVLNIWPAKKDDVLWVEGIVNA